MGTSWGYVDLQPLNFASQHGPANGGQGCWVWLGIRVRRWSGGISGVSSCFGTHWVARVVDCPQISPCKGAARLEVSKHS